jgi:hypothetical protein
MFVTIPAFTIFNKIKVVVRLCGQLAGHECELARLGREALILAEVRQGAGENKMQTR